MIASVEGSQTCNAVNEQKIWMTIKMQHYNETFQVVFFLILSCDRSQFWFHLHQAMSDFRMPLMQQQHTWEQNWAPMVSIPLLNINFKVAINTKTKKMCNFSDSEANWCRMCVTFFQFSCCFSWWCFVLNIAFADAKFKEHFIFSTKKHNM